MISLRKGNIITFLLLTFLTAAFLITGCAGGDTTTVTINIGNQVLPVSGKATLFDRILAFFTFGREANAQVGAPLSFELNITGPGMIPITRAVPDDTKTLTLDIPSGSARVFTAVGYEINIRKIGGIVTRDLASGEIVTIPIQLGLLPDPPDNNTAHVFDSPVQLDWGYTTEPPDIVGFIIYRAPQDTGPFIPIVARRKNDFDYDGSYYNFTDYSGTSSNPGPDYSHYRVSAINQFGEGEWEDFYHC